MRDDLGLVAVTLAGLFLLYQAFLGSAGVVVQLAYLGGDAASLRLRDVAVSLGPTISITAAGLYLVLGRHYVADSLFGPRQKREGTSSLSLSLEHIVAAVGLVFLVLGLKCLAEVSPDWIISNLRGHEVYQDRPAIDVWPYRVSAVLEFFCGWVLLFRAQSVAAYVRSRTR